jgi:hypothetical protein
MKNEGNKPSDKQSAVFENHYLSSAQKTLKFSTPASPLDDFVEASAVTKNHSTLSTAFPQSSIRCNQLNIGEEFGSAGANNA